MPSKRTTLRHLSRSLTQPLLASTFPDTPASTLYRALDARSREIYDNSANKRRAERRTERLKKQHALQKRRAKQRPKPLSAKERRRLCFDEIPHAERKWVLYESLRTLWRGYVREILGLGGEGASNGAGGAGAGGGEARAPYITPLTAGPILAAADMHGAVVECVRSRCVSRVGVRGVVVQDRKFVFVVITEKDELKTLPKEHSIFQIRIPPGPEGEDDQKDLVFEIHGEQFQNRAPDRSKKQFKAHYNPDL